MDECSWCRKKVSHRALWCTRLVSGRLFLWLKCQQMCNNLDNLMSVVISNGWKGHDANTAADQRGGNLRLRTPPRAFPPFHFYWFWMGEKWKTKGEKKSLWDLHTKFHLHLRGMRDFIPSKQPPWWGCYSPDSRIRYSHIWTGRMTGNVKCGSGITIRPWNVG